MSNFQTAWTQADTQEKARLEDEALAILGASIRHYEISDRQAAITLFSEDIEAYARQSD